MSKADSIKLYADFQCKQPINTIEWDNRIIITLVDGSEEMLPNTAEAGGTATAIAYLRNETRFRFGITNISFPDKRLKIEIGNKWLMPGLSTKIVVSFKVPKEITPDDVIKPNNIIIDGYYIYTP